jgi:hypothetical protein
MSFSWGYPLATSWHLSSHQCHQSPKRWNKYKIAQNNLLLNKMIYCISLCGIFGRGYWKKALWQVGDEVTKDEPLTTNPNVGGFGQVPFRWILWHVLSVMCWWYHWFVCWWSLYCHYHCSRMFLFILVLFCDIRINMQGAYNIPTQGWLCSVLSLWILGVSLPGLNIDYCW